jgi:hypothetical protein
MKHRTSRRRDSGSITVIGIFMLIALMAMAGLAVDLGFLYTRSRMMYAVADSAITIGMADFTGGATTSVPTDIDNIMGQYGTYYTYTKGISGNVLTVTVSHQYSLFFGKMFGFPNKTLTVVAKAQRSAGAPALLALGTACSGVGLTINGSGSMTINGDVQGNGLVNSQTGNSNGLCPSGGTAMNVSGNMESACPGGPEASGSPGHHCWDAVSGTYGMGSVMPDPYAPFTVPTCDYGGTSTGGDPTTGHWTTVVDATLGTVSKLDPGVYCSTSAFNINGFAGNGVDCSGVTFIANGASIGFGFAKASRFSPAATAPNNVVAYTNLSIACSSGQAIQFGGPASGLATTVAGSLYAPNGCVNIGANGPMTITGSVIGNELQIGDYSAWTIGTSGGGGGTSWQMLQ